MNIDARSFLVADARLRKAMIESGRFVHTATWQGRDIAARPDAEMVELLNVTLQVDLRGVCDMNHWRAEIRPNLPWADDHFEERVGGAPLNPPASWAWWPWAKSAGSFRDDQKFNHTYPERFWPKYAGERSGTLAARDGSSLTPHLGIRGTYGDLRDVIELLRKDPLTRQAYLPIFFPEDTGIGDGGRKPCTLGYQFIVREDKLHIFYPMRSCDLVRHFRDDAYLAVRLGQWILEQLRFSLLAADTDSKKYWELVSLGSLTMHMTSLHCFIGDWHLMKKEMSA